MLRAGNGVTIEVVLLVLAVAIVCCCLAARLAKRKGFDPATWGFAGLLFGPLGLLAAVGLPDYSTQLDRDMYRGRTTIPLPQTLGIWSDESVHLAVTHFEKYTEPQQAVIKAEAGRRGILGDQTAKDL
jgi:hypothetical protein